MTTTIRSGSPRRVRMSPTRKAALAGGILYLITFATSIPALLLKDTARHNVNFILGAGSTTGVMWGGFLDVILAFACIGTAVALYPVAKRQSETAALGYVAARVLEAAIIIVGVLSLFSIVTLRQGAAGADAASLLTTGKSLVALHEWTFLLGPGLIPAVNALCLGYVLYRSRLVPRIIPTIGLIGAPLILVSATATMFGAFTQTSSTASLLALPIAAWELSLGLWMTFKGFKSSPLTDEMDTNSDIRVLADVAA